MAPVFTLMESVVLKKMRQYVGWPDGEGDGLFAPGNNNTLAFLVGEFSLASPM